VLSRYRLSATPVECNSGIAVHSIDANLLTTTSLFKLCVRSHLVHLLSSDIPSRVRTKQHLQIPPATAVEVLEPMVYGPRPALNTSYRCSRHCIPISTSMHSVHFVSLENPSSVSRPRRPRVCIYSKNSSLAPQCDSNRRPAGGKKERPARPKPGCRVDCFKFCSYFPGNTVQQCKIYTASMVRR
jgi:hypothetical protein